MPKRNIARDRIWPADPNILVRVVILYVGQGSSAIVLVADGSTYKCLVVDINLDRKTGGIDVPRLVKDLLDGGELFAFANTHPHDDHLRGVKELSDQITIREVWHSGHIPSKKYGSCYQDLRAVIKKVRERGGQEIVLEGSRSPKKLGDAQCYVLAPAEYVTDEVNEEEADARRARIHEQCAVLKFGQGSAWIMIPGDADRAAFEKHITQYHKQRLGAFALAASHHGSRTFFMENEGDDPYLDGLRSIGPTYVAISAPTQEESPHGHPHDDAVELYADEVGDKNVLHTGEERLSFIFDIYRDGGHSGIQDDSGSLAEAYGLEDEDDGDRATKAMIQGPFVRPRSQTGDLTPRKYG